MQTKLQALSAAMLANVHRKTVGSMAVLCGVSLLSLHSSPSYAQTSTGDSIRVHATNDASQSVRPALTAPGFSMPTANTMGYNITSLPSAGDRNASRPVASPSDVNFAAGSTDSAIDTVLGASAQLPVLGGPVQTYGEVVTSDQLISSEPFIVGSGPIIDDPSMMMGQSYMPQGNYRSAGPMQRNYSNAPTIGYDLGSFGSCGPDNCRIYYFSAEALYWKQNEDQSLTFSQGRQLSEFDYEWAGRVTIGEMFDCVKGVEFVYTGPFEWNRTRRDVEPGLNSTIQIASGFAAADIDTFVNSNLHDQNLRTQLSTYEINRRWFSSDLFSTLVGLRFVDYNERINFNTVASDNVGRGFFQQNLDNLMIGAQVGANMYRPISQRLSVGGWTKLGVFANFSENRSFLSNRAATLVNSNRSDTDIAGLLQGGIGARYRILPRLDLTAGYEALILPGVATVGEQNTFPLTQTSSNDVQANDTVFFHGANVGFEFSY